jgi:hypothetical protein
MEKTQILLKFSAFLHHPSRVTHPIAPWMLALAAYLALALAFQIYVFSARTSLPEPDDAYTYVLKSAQLAEGCAMQDCPALNTLRDQLRTPSAGETAEWMRYRMASRVFLVYHPLYSGLLLALNEAGLSWEAGYVALSLLGTVLIGAGVTFFLVTLWGPAAAALALLLLSFSIFPGQGLSAIVPSNIALGLAFLAWGFALRGQRWWMAALILLALLMHPVAKVYGVVALIMAVVARRDLRLSLASLLPLLAATGLIGVAAALPLLIEQPVLRVEAERMPEGFTMLDGLLANLWKAARIVSRGYGREPLIGIPLALALYWLAWRGLSAAPVEDRRKRLCTLAILACMCGVLLVHVLPHYPAEAFQRAWVVLAVFLAGAAGFGLAGPGGILHGDISVGRLRFQPAHLGLAFLALFVATGAKLVAERAANFRDRHYQSFDPAQVARLTQTCGTAFYGDETAILFYLSHGANACPAVYLPALKGTSTPPHRFTGLAGPQMLVAAKPGPREIVIAPHRPATLAIAHGNGRLLHLRLAPTTAADAVLRIRMATDGRAETREVSVPPDGGLVTLTLLTAASDQTLTLAVPKGGTPVALEGMHFDGAAQDWPWNHAVLLTQQRRSYAFDAPTLTNGLFSAMDVIDSRGSTVLARLDAPHATAAQRP